MTLLIVITWLCVLIVVFCLFYYVWDDRNKRKLHEHRRVEISELAMVFQTLRDVVSEQKILAKEFNEQVEEKLLLVRTMVNESQSRMKKIQQEISEQYQTLKDLQEQIDRIVCQKNALLDISARDVKSVETISIIEAESVYGELTNNLEVEKDKNVFHYGFDERDREDVVIDDRNKDMQVALSKEIKQEELEKDDEERGKIGKGQENIREDYRPLLVGSVDEGIQVKMEKTPISNQYNVEERNELTPIQKMVLEYHNAGMTTGEIARELGKTKGEVRLILSLALSKHNEE